MKRLTLAILFSTIGLSACVQRSQKEDNYIQTYSGVVETIREYPNMNCDVVLENGNWARGVNLNDCRNLNIGDRILIVEKVENGLVYVNVQKLNPNLPQPADFFMRIATTS